MCCLICPTGLLRRSWGWRAWRTIPLGVSICQVLGVLAHFHTVTPFHGAGGGTQGPCVLGKCSATELCHLTFLVAFYHFFPPCFFLQKRKGHLPSTATKKLPVQTSSWFLRWTGWGCLYTCLASTLPFSSLWQNILMFKSHWVPWWPLPLSVHGPRWHFR